MACLWKAGKKEVRTVSTRTEDLWRLLDGLSQEGCTPGAMESTGVYWRAVLNIREGTLDVILTPARDANGYQARKTDVMDAEGRADLLRHGLLKPSFLPPRPMRALRELTRDRESLVREQPGRANRIQKLLESANLKRGQVASAALGVRGKARLRALAAGATEAKKMSPLARRPRKRKPPQLPQALEGRMTEAQRWVLGQLRDQYDQVEAARTRGAERIKPEVETRADPFVPEAVKRLDTLPGVGETGAQIIGGEIGVDRERFPTDHPLARWAGRCPGTKESAGKRKRGKTSKGRRYLRAVRVQAAWAASHQKGTYLAAPYNRVVKRRGKKKAWGAVGHSSLIIVYHVLQKRVPYQDWGGDYFERRHGSTQRQRLISQLEALGVKVTVEEVQEAA